MATRMERELRKLLEQKKKEAQQKQDEYDIFHAKAAMGVLTDCLKNYPDACRLLGDRSSEQISMIAYVIATHMREHIDEAMEIISMRKSSRER